MRIWLALLSCVFAAGLAASAAAKEDTPPQTLDELDARLAQLFKDGHIPGASVAIVENGQIVFAKGYGVTDTRSNTPVDQDTVFRAGSISKSITGIAIMQMVEAGKLSLDAKVANLAPDVHFDNPYEATDPLRLVHLIEHTTGWPDIRLRILALDAKGWTTLQGVQDASADFVSRWKPGYFPVYNNAGPAVAGVILEKASGESYSDYVRGHVLRPMGMAVADFERTPAVAARLAKSYDADGAEVPYQYISLPPAGSLAVSAPELAQLVKFFLGRGTIDGVQMLKFESVARIERAETTLAAKYGFTNGYGLGNAPFPDAGIAFRGHNGGIDGFTSVYGYNARVGGGYVLMANGGEGVDFGTPAARLIQAYLTRGLHMQQEPEVKISPEALSQYTGIYENITPPNTLVKPFTDILNIQYATVEDGKLMVMGSPWVATGEHSFRRDNREEPSLAFFEHDGTIYKASAFYVAAMMPLWRVIVTGAVAIILALGVVIAIPMVPVWIVSAIRGRLREKGGLLMRVTPVVAIVAMLATFLLVLLAVQGSGTSSIHQLADVGPYSVAILVCSVLFPLLAIAGLAFAVMRTRASWFARIYVGAVSAALIVCGIYTATIGWLPAMTWNM